jgi:MFS family permease
MPPTVDAYAAVRSANYRLFAAGFLCSSTGLQMLATALGWEVFERTRDPWHLGLLGLARALPVVALALFAGHAADSFSRKLLLVSTQAAFALLCIGLAFASHAQAPLWVVYALVVATGCVRSLNGPTRQAILPTLVPTHAFQNAVTWNSGLFHFAATVGPIIAGIMLAKLPPSYVYTVAAASIGTFAITGLFLTPLVPHVPTGRFTAAGLFAGFAHVRREKTVLGALSLDCLGVMLGGATALLPVYATEILKVGPEGLGVLRAAPYLGAVVGSFVLAHLPPFRNTGRTLLLAVAAWGVAILVFGLSTNIWVSLVALFASGVIDNVSVVIRHVLVQVRTPPEVRGRVGAVNSMFIECSNELGGFESGAVAALAGPVFSVVSGAIGTLAVVGLIAWAFPDLRKLRRLQDPEP